jgi:hypothetical protein
LGEIAAQLAVANEDRWPRWVWFTFADNSFPINVKEINGLSEEGEGNTRIYLRNGRHPWLVNGTIKEVAAKLGIPAEE